MKTVVVFKRDTDFTSPKPGHYSLAHRSALEWSICQIGCPKCGWESNMSPTVHKVAADGTVSPSYICPHTTAAANHQPCNFHESIKLDGWVPPV